MVSSTTPRLGPRWPPVLESTVISSWRISAASFSKFWIESRFTSAGELILSSRRSMQFVRAPFISRCAIKLECELLRKHGRCGGSDAFEFPDSRELLCLLCRYTEHVAHARS